VRISTVSKIGVNTTVHYLDREESFEQSQSGQSIRDLPLDRFILVFIFE